MRSLWSKLKTGEKVKKLRLVARTLVDNAIDATPRR
jgi:hypothetical protein